MAPGPATAAHAAEAMADANSYLFNCTRSFFKCQVIVGGGSCGGFLGSETAVLQCLATWWGGGEPARTKRWDD